MKLTLLIATVFCCCKLAQLFLQAIAKFQKFQTYKNKYIMSINPTVCPCCTLLKAWNLHQISGPISISIPDFPCGICSLEEPNCETIVKDRNAHGGGVLIALRNDFIADPQNYLNTTCELVWTKVHFFRNKAIYLASYFRH